MANWKCDICGYQYSYQEQRPGLVRDKKGDHLKVCKKCAPKVQKLIGIIRDSPSIKEKLLALIKRE